jgi:hypothetical protein
MLATIWGDAPTRNSPLSPWDSERAASSNASACPSRARLCFTSSAPSSTWPLRAKPKAPTDAAPVLDFEAITVGAGMSGMYQKALLRDELLNDFDDRNG